jgi:hypothetical protein
MGIDEPEATGATGVRAPVDVAVEAAAAGGGIGVLLHPAKTALTETINMPRLSLLMQKSPKNGVGRSRAAQQKPELP